MLLWAISCRSGVNSRAVHYASPFTDSSRAANESAQFRFAGQEVGPDKPVQPESKNKNGWQRALPAVLILIWKI